MALNILVNAVIGMVPVVGDLFVLWYKPNIRNYKILERYAGRANAVTRGDWLFVSILIGSTFFLIVAVTVLLVYVTVSQFRWW
jgi:ABC-type multidrug transport system permease subunit